MYENIKTVKELLNEVTAHGLSLAPEDITKAQDIVGHAPIGELIALARDNGRRNKNGEPDPDGPWSSGSDGTQQRFISLLFNLWHWEDAVRFYNSHVNPEIKAYKAKIYSLQDALEKISNDPERSSIECEMHRIKADVKRFESENQRLKRDNALLNQSVLELKAKLYDLSQGNAQVQDLKYPFLLELIQKNGHKLVRYNETVKGKKYVPVFEYSVMHGGTLDSYRYYNDYVVEVSDGE